MLPPLVALYFVLAIVRGGGEVKVDNNIDKHQRVVEITKEEEGEARLTKEEQEGGERSSRELLFERPTTLQRMLEEASHFG